MSSPSRSDVVGIDWDARIPATWLLIAVIVVAHVVTAVLTTVDIELWRALLLDRSVRFRVLAGGQYRVLVDSGEVWRLFTSVLLHGDGLHLLVNAVALGSLGRVLEPWVGSMRWLAWFWIGGIGGSLMSQWAQVAQSDGASGGAFALLGAAAVLAWRIRDRIHPSEKKLLGPVLWVFVALNVVLSFALPFVDAAGHVGGLLCGLVLGAVARPLQPRRGTGVAATVFVVGCFGVCAVGWLG